MAEFSIGGDNVIGTQRNLYLQYLNVAHQELYSETALINEAVSSVTVFNDIYDLENGILIKEEAMLVSSVFDLNNKRELNKKTQSEAMRLSVDQSGSPRLFSSSFDLSVPQFQVFLYPAPVTANVFVTWIKNIVDFTETTKSYNIPYPPVFHRILVDGGLWYVFQEEGGFKDSLKAKESKIRWERGKQKLATFLFNSSEDQSRVAYNV